MLTREKMLDDIALTLNAEYCTDLDGGLEVVLGRLTDEQVKKLHDDFSDWFGISWQCQHCGIAYGSDVESCERTACSQ